ncbi:MAG: HDOD domain-containing protein [Burkholderiales bacterium]|nr:HDOD domain-containing protein [Burkholderiales bacterium]
MTVVAKSAEQAEAQLLAHDTDALVKDIGIPPRPSMLVDLQTEMAKDEPNFRRIGALVSTDVAMTVALLKVANSPLYGLSRRCETVDQAVAMLGLKQVGSIVTGLVLRKVLPVNGPQLVRFWDVSGKRAHAMARLARQLGGVGVDVAQSFGLFCDVGIPLLMGRFPTYGKTLKACNEETVLSFTEVEHAAHQTDHALVGGMMARGWGLSPTLYKAIRLHHDYEIFHDRHTPPEIIRLIAMGLVAEVAIQRFAGLNSSTEWNKGGDLAAGALVLSDLDVEETIERLLEDFSQGLA